MEPWSRCVLSTVFFWEYDVYEVKFKAGKQRIIVSVLILVQNHSGKMSSLIRGVIILLFHWEISIECSGTLKKQK